MENLEITQLPQNIEAEQALPVSYTHLTLPTKA